MTHFIARFPQHIKPVSDPTPWDYLNASEWYRLRGNYWIAEEFYCTYRKVKWANEIWLHRKPDDTERAG